MAADNGDSSPFVVATQRRRFRRPLAAIADVGFLYGLAILVVGAFVGLAVFVPYLPIVDPAVMELPSRFMRPFVTSAHVFGTDQFGRDILSRTIWGLRSSLMIALIAVAIATILGTFLGVVGGYVGGLVERGVQFVTDVLMAFPSLVIGVILIVLLGRGRAQLMIAIALALLARLIRIARGQVMPIREMMYIESARALGCRTSRTMWRHVLPNMSREMLLTAILWFATAITMEAGLGFLGLGLNPPTPSLGGIIRDGMRDLFQAPWITLTPAIALSLISVNLNLIGDYFQSRLEKE